MDLLLGDSFVPSPSLLDSLLPEDPAFFALGLVDDGLESGASLGIDLLKNQTERG